MQQIRKKYGLATGFTLLEILITFLIIGISLGIALLSYPYQTEAQQTEEELQRLIHLLEDFHWQLQITGNTGAVVVEPETVSLYQLREEAPLLYKQMTMNSESHFKQKVNIENFPENYVILLPTGEVTPFEWSVQTKQVTYALSFDQQWKLK